MTKLFILCGASGAGKSTLLNTLINNGICEAVKKYSERQKFNAIDDVTSIDDIEKKELGCDIIYSMYGNRYGLNSKKILQDLKSKNQILITNDNDTIEKFKKILYERTVVIYVLSDINKEKLLNIYLKRFGYPSLEHQKDKVQDYFDKCINALKDNHSQEFFERIFSLNSLFETVIPDYASYKLRAESVEKISENYMENLFFYNYIVLNFYVADSSLKHATQSAFEQLVKIIQKETELNLE